MAHKILIISADKSWQERYALWLSHLANLDVVSNVSSGLLLLSRGHHLLVVVDHDSKSAGEIDNLISEARQFSCDVILMASESTNVSRQSLFKAGAAFVFTKKEISEIVFTETVSQILQRKSAQQAETINAVEIIRSGSYFSGTSPVARQLEHKLHVLKNTSSHILLTGETGVGKTLIAKRLHCGSNRHKHEFMHINCPSIPEHLLESELFGYLRGAFTGAIENKKGKFEQAGSGTVFLDEIGEIDDKLQAKLLKVIDDRTYYPLSSLKPVTVNARLIAATNVDLKKAVAQGRFRKDLYFRLNTFHLEIMPLRKQKEDIPALFDLFIENECKKLNRPIPEVDPEVYLLLTVYDWPGNIREMQNAVESMMIFQPKRITTDIIPINTEKPTENQNLTSSGKTMTLREVQRYYVRVLLAKNKNNKSRTAELLQIDRKTLYSLLEPEGTGK